jgi:hypothetical protein
MSKTLEQSEFTSIQERLNLFARRDGKNNSSWLAPLVAEEPKSPESHEAKTRLPITQTDYFALVDWTGRAVRADKRGAIPSHVKPILHKLDIKESNWVDNTKYFGKRFGRALGRIDQLKAFAEQVSQNYLHGHAQSRAFYR